MIARTLTRVGQPRPTPEPCCATTMFTTESSNSHRSHWAGDMEQLISRSDEKQRRAEACKTWSSGSSVVAGLRSRTRTGVRLGARLTATHGGAACGGRQLPRHTIRDTGAAEADTCRSAKGLASPRPCRHNRQSGHARRQLKPGALPPSGHSWNSEPKLGDLVCGKQLPQRSGSRPCARRTTFGCTWPSWVAGSSPKDRINGHSVRRALSGLSRGHY